jgi:hypothetical protein
MPLPFAPPPKDSSLYQQLESTTLQTLTADQLDTIRAKTFSQGTEGNEDEYRRLLLLALAANQLSLSGPMPGTVDVVNFTSDTSGAVVAMTEDGFFKEPGSVWKIFAPSLSVGGGSGSIQHELRMINSGSTLEILDFSSSGGSLRPTVEEGFIGGEIYVSYPAYLTYEATGTFTSAGLSLGIVRVR